MQTMNSAKFSLLMLAILLALNPAASASLSGISEAGEIALNVHKRLLIHEPPMRPSETLEILKRIERFLRNEKDSTARTAADQVRNLIGLSEIDEFNCLRNRFIYAQAQAQNNNQTNILVYLNHNKQAQYDFCKDLLLNQDLAKLTGEEQLKLEQLISSVQGEENLKHSIANYLSDSLINSQRLAPLEATEVSDLFEKSVGNLCRSIETITNNAADFFFTSMLDLDLVERRLSGDKELRAAMRSVGICRLANRERDSMIRLAHDLVGSKTRARLEKERSTVDDE